MAGNPQGLKAMILGLQLTLLGFINIVTEFWIFSGAIGSLLITIGTAMSFSGFAVGRGK